MRLVIKIQITWANKNILGYFSKYKLFLPPPAEQSRIQPHNGVQKRAQKNLFGPRLGLVLPSIVASFNGWVTPLDPWESQEEITTVDIYGYEVFGCFAFITVIVGHAKRQLIYSIRSELMAFSARHRDINIF